MIEVLMNGTGKGYLKELLLRLKSYIGWHLTENSFCFILLLTDIYSYLNLIDISTLTVPLNQLRHRVLNWIVSLNIDYCIWFCIVLKKQNLLSMKTQTLLYNYCINTFILSFFQFVININCYRGHVKLYGLLGLYRENWSFPRKKLTSFQSNSSFYRLNINL